MANNNSSSSGIGCGTVIFLIFLVLKLLHISPVANWSWWWVTCPLWIGIAVMLIVLGIFVIIDRFSD